jgi:cytochrome c-type biogenesis protein CcmF
MISAFGNLSLGAAVLLAPGAVLASVASVRFGSAAGLKIARWCIVAIALLLTVASGALITALLTNDFRFEYVASYTERALPLGYKLAAFWAGQEGSLLLWAWLLAVMCVCAVAGFRSWRGPDHAITVAVLAVVCGFFAALMLFAANPFAFVEGQVPPDGRGLNPMLQDPGMIAHPPLLFLGYAGFTVPFAVLIGVLVANRSDNRWIARIRRWLVVSWMFLTAGIVLGAWWAYIELGWGGYWAWDPVENASLLPWFTATAVLHSLMVQQHRGMFKKWNAALIALSFILCIFGTYLTRSGVIESVHAFAPSLVGMFFLVFLAVCTFGSAALMVWRRRVLRPEHQLEGLISREGAFLGGNVLLTVMMLTTLVGTTFPILSAPFGEQITVGQPFYNRLVAPMGILLAALMALGPVLAFGKSAAAQIARSLIVPGIAAAVTTVVVGIFMTVNPWALVCVAVATLGTFAVIVGFVRSASARRRSTGEGWVVAAIRLIDRDHRRYGGQTVHLGLMMIVIGITGSSLFKVEQTHQLGPGESAQIAGAEVTFVSLDEVREINYTAVQATVEFTGADGTRRIMKPQKRFYDKWEGEPPNTEVAVRSDWRRDVYVILAGWEGGGKVTALQVKVTPLVLWIWIGGIVMTLGTLFCAMPQMLPRKRRAAAVEQTPAVTAEQVLPASAMAPQPETRP